MALAICSMARVSSGTASATCPDSVYVVPKAGAIKGNQAELGDPPSARGPSTVQAGEGPRQVTLAESEQTKPPRGHYEAPGATVRLGDPAPFFAEGDPFGEAPQLGMARGERGAGEHSGELRETEALAAMHPVEGRDGLPAVVYRSMIVTLEPVGKAEEVVRQCLEDNLPTGRSERQGALAGGDGLVMRAHDIEMVAQKERDLSEPTRVVEDRSEGLGSRSSARTRPKSPDGLSALRRANRRSMACSHVSRCLWQMREGTERLLEVSHGLTVG